jgi:hypothetical protein
MPTHPSRLLALLSLALATAAGLPAQSAAPAAPKLEFPAPSPAATVKQRVGLTDVEVTYSRPSMRGRKIFGGLESYGKVWRTGANSATKVTFSTPVKFGGTAVAAGSYALFTIPGESEWTVILNQVTGQWGAYAYDEKNDLARVKVAPASLPSPVETFTIGFDDLQNESSATLSLAWEKTHVSVKIDVDLVGTLVPQIEAVMASDAAKKPYYAAAMFYYENNLDLKKALGWLEAAIAANPKAFYLVYRKGLILEKMGDKAGAIAAAEASLAAAEKETGAIRDEYVRLNQGLLARLR